jgi:hypothetical protein
MNDQVNIKDLTHLQELSIEECNKICGGMCFDPNAQLDTTHIDDLRPSAIARANKVLSSKFGWGY